MTSHLKLRLEQVLLAMLLLGTAKVCAQTLPYAPARDVVREDELQRRVTAVRTLKEHLEINGKSVKPGTARRIAFARCRETCGRVHLLA